jgi:hypothetical protein
LADVNAADVWSSQQALYGNWATLSGDIGDQLNPEINVILPQGVAAFRSRPISVTMTENRNALVTINYPLR